MSIWYEIIIQKFLYLKLPIFYQETDFGKSDYLGRPIAHDKEWHPILMGNKLYFYNATSSSNVASVIKKSRRGWWDQIDLQPWEFG